MASRYFINRNTSLSQDLPQALAIFARESYLARLLHAEVGHYNKPLARRPEPHEHDCYHLVLVTGGSGHFYVNGTTYATRPGQVYLTGPNQLHQFMNSGRDSTCYAEVTFEMVNRKGKSLKLKFEEMLEIWTNQSCPLVSGMTLSPASVRLLEGKLERLIEAGQSQARDLELNIHLADILMRAFLGASQDKAAATGQPLDAIRDHIRARYQERLSLSELASRARLTPNYLSRHFKKLYGQTPIDYQIDLRMRSACGLLKTVNDTLDQVAKYVGFDDVYYFSRLFKKRMGQSPGSYRMGSGKESTASRRVSGQPGRAPKRRQRA